MASDTENAAPSAAPQPKAPAPTPAPVATPAPKEFVALRDFAARVEGQILHFVKDEVIESRIAAILHRTGAPVRASVPSEAAKK